MEVAILPDEIQSIICQELGRQLDFSTLYNCARSAKSLADAALRIMYQYHHESPAFSQSEDAVSRQRVGNTQFFRRWTILWRSIIASSMKNARTYKPYCQYIRILDLRNLSYMLEDFWNLGSDIQRDFFAAPLKKLQRTKQENKRQRLDIISIIHAVGETVIPRAGMLEEITGELQPDSLGRWIVQIPHLLKMSLWNGDALDQRAGAAIAEHCEHFRELSILACQNPDADEVFAGFLKELSEETLQYFEMIGFNSLAKLSFEGLGKQKSLNVLKLDNLSKEAMENLSTLKECTEIHELSLMDATRSVQLEALNNDVFVDVVQWLSSCTKLRDITLKFFYDAPSILAQVAVAPSVSWKRLSVEGHQTTGYSLRNPNTAAFHTALSEQTSLEKLELKGSGEDSTPDDLSIMVASISNLFNLKELLLKDISDEFDESHIITLACNLPQLEVFWTSGGECSSDVLPVIANNLKYLKNMTFMALTQFSLDDILDFIGMLDPHKQRGFNLSLIAVDQQFDLSEEERQLVRDMMRTRVEGRLEFDLWRDADPSDSDSD